MFVGLPPIQSKCPPTHTHTHLSLVRPIPGQKPRTKDGLRGPAATEEERKTFEDIKDAFAESCKTFARGGSTAPENAPIPKPKMLRYRRGESGAAVLATPYARKALDGAFATGIDETEATISQTSMMDTKVRFPAP